jgi:hypothetical protein
MIKSWFVCPPDQESELAVFDLEKNFEDRVEAIRKAGMIQEQDRILQSIQFDLSKCAAIPENRRIFLAKWIDRIRLGAYSAVGINVNAQNFFG